jgi:hypothetical protein
VGGGGGGDGDGWKREISKGSSTHHLLQKWVIYAGRWGWADFTFPPCVWKERGWWMSFPLSGHLSLAFPSREIAKGFLPWSWLTFHGKPSGMALKQSCSNIDLGRVQNLALRLLHSLRDVIDPTSSGTRNRLMSNNMFSALMAKSRMDALRGLDPTDGTYDCSSVARLVLCPGCQSLPLTTICAFPVCSASSEARLSRKLMQLTLGKGGCRPGRNIEKDHL